MQVHRLPSAKNCTGAVDIVVGMAQPGRELHTGSTHVYTRGTARCDTERGGNTQGGITSRDGKRRRERERSLAVGAGAGTKTRLNLGVRDGRDQRLNEEERAIFTKEGKTARFCFFSFSASLLPTTATACKPRRTASVGQTRSRCWLNDLGC